MSALDESRLNSLSYRFGERTNGILVGPDISVGHRQVPVPQQMTYREGIDARLGSVSPDCMAKVVNADIIDARMRSQTLPAGFDILLADVSFRIGRAWKHEW